MPESTVIALPHGAIGRVAARLGVSRGHLSRVLNGKITTSGQLAVQLIWDPDVVAAKLDFARLTGIVIPAGTPLGQGVVALEADEQPARDPHEKRAKACAS